MLIIGERINSTRPAIQEAIKTRNANLILKEAAAQIKCGAGFIDVNCAVTSGDEVQDMDWILSVLQNGIKDANICIDSPNYLAIDKALGVYNAKGSLMINSITGESSRLDRIVPLAAKHNTRLIALTMTERGMPATAQGRLDIARQILERVKGYGFDTENLYFDPLIRPISTEPEQAREFLKAIPLIKGLGVKTICGLSNVSFGLPNRRLINSTFLTMAIQSGLDAAILDPTDKEMLSAIKTSSMLLGLDDFCANYIKAFREGQLV